MELKFLRKKHIIRELFSDGTFEDKHYFAPRTAMQTPSISAAKRASRELQVANGGMGRGSLRVVEKFPEMVSEKEQMAAETGPLAVAALLASEEA